MRIVIALVALIAVGAAYSIGVPPPSEPASEGGTATSGTTSPGAVSVRCASGEAAPTGRLVGDRSVLVEDGLGLDPDCVAGRLATDAPVVVTSAELAERLCAPLEDATDGCWNGSRAVIPVDLWLAGDDAVSNRLAELAPVG